MSSNILLLPDFEAHPSGAVFLPSSKTLLIADLHLGYGWAQRRLGELGPIADERTRDKLLRVTDELSPDRIVFLGDVVHAPKPCTAEREWVREILEGLSTRAELIAVRGNHDRAFSRDFSDLPVQTIEEWSDDRLLAVHGNKLPELAERDGRILVFGHFHPSVPILDAAGASRRLPAFLVTSRCVVLPAFSPFAKGYDVGDGLPAELGRIAGESEMEAYAATPTRVVRLGSLSRLLERMRETNTGAPGQFRSHRRSGS